MAEKRWKLATESAGGGKATPATQTAGVIGAFLSAPKGKGMP